MSAPILRLITIFGATGNQGSSVARSLLANPSVFAVRALTRKPSSKTARILAAMGAEVVGIDDVVTSPDFFDDSSHSFSGSWGVFININGDDPALDPIGGEKALGEKLVAAAAQAGVKVLVYSGMASAKESTDGKVTEAKSFDGQLSLLFDFVSFYFYYFFSTLPPFLFAH